MSVYLDLDITLKSNIIYNYQENYIYQVIYHNSGDNIIFIIIKSNGSVYIYKNNFTNLINTRSNSPIKKYITLDHINRSMHKNIYQDENMKNLLDKHNIIINLDQDKQEYINIPLKRHNDQPSELRLNSHFHDLYQDYLYLKNHEYDFNMKKCILDISMFIILCLVYISVFLIIIGVFLGLIYIGQSL